MIWAGSWCPFLAKHLQTYMPSSCTNGEWFKFDALYPGHRPRVVTEEQKDAKIELNFIFLKFKPAWKRLKSLSPKGNGSFYALGVSKFNQSRGFPSKYVRSILVPFHSKTIGARAKTVFELRAQKGATEEIRRVFWNLLNTGDDLTALLKIYFKIITHAKNLQINIDITDQLCEDSSTWELTSKEPLKK